MTDTPPETTTADVATNGADSGDAPGELDGPWTLYSTGGASVKVDGKVFRLRRPSMGQLKELRDALGSVSDAIRHESDNAQVKQRVNRALGERLQKQIDALDETADNFPDELRRLHGEAQALADDNMATGRALTDMIDEQYWSWWKLVFKLLSFNGTPDTWPSWAANATAALQVTQHWRDNPLARG